MANIANFVSVWIANASRFIILFTVYLSVINVISRCAAEKTSGNIRSALKEYQNGEENVEIFADNFKTGKENEFERLKSRVVVSNGKTILPVTGMIQILCF